MISINKTQQIKIKELEQKLEVDGYAIIDNFLTQQQIEHLTEVYYNGLPEDLSQKSWMYSTGSSDVPYKRKVGFAIRENFRNQINSLFPEYKLNYGFFLNKKPQKKDTELGIHQDAFIVDEKQFKAYHVWCPLINVDENNGCLKLIPKSHHLRRFLKSGNTSIDDRYVKIMRNYLISVPMNAGQALIFNQRLLHASFPNMSKIERIAAVLAITSPKSTFLYHHPDDPVSPTEFEVFEVEDHFFENFVSMGKDLDNQFFKSAKRKSIGTTKNECISFTKREILETLNDDPENKDLLFLKNIKITFKIVVLNIEEQLFDLKGMIKKLLKGIIK